MRRNFPYNPKLKERARKLRRDMTPSETKLWFGYLRNSEYRFLRQKPLGNYIADFYCPSKKLVIEVDGEHHYTEKVIEYDRIRTEFLNSLGINVVRIRNREICNNFSGVCRMLDELMIIR